MPDLLLTVLVVVTILLVADLLFAGGAMAMTGMGAVRGAVSHPLVAGALVLLVVALILLPRRRAPVFGRRKGAFG